jgi:signal peptidase I
VGTTDVKSQNATDNSKKALILKALRIFLIVFFSIGFLRIFVLELFFIPSSSMSNTLLAGDFVIVSRMSYFFGFPARLPLFNIKSPIRAKLWYDRIKRGDVIIFGSPDPDEIGGSSHNIIKRVVAVPGDTLVVIGNIAYVNGKKQSLPPLSATTEQSSASDDTVQSRIVVPKCHMTLHLTEDNYLSYKSVIVNEGNFIYARDGQVFINDKPASTYTVREDYYYVIGDNRAISSDSRQWGFLPENNIIGRPLFIFLSIGSDSYFQDKSIRFNRIGNVVR